MTPGRQLELHLALAAIVEKEARLPEERPVIAAVYLKPARASVRAA